ncbi:hypothetical protein Mp_3g20850 [Marchantia polymorpha subsp. ruderalis]|uniref:Uncharacterized protein n=2 Tax=Marchantia polymorpha TaxID=3197 RepID=A0AAF6B319_MARPO|nr:hypothetical protein MARPO_0159s0015 [Marchantia polymorpha]BBN06403.1 hypothetical protein Mp_3g20850 [Marchantia polymorpha subsp. ruderalis]|eukprot:PTQ28598.1 hypothetical protein MARPO_0159s0015 [Marchantia polymorpha]
MVLKNFNARFNQLAWGTSYSESHSTCKKTSSCRNGASLIRLKFGLATGIWTSFPKMYTWGADFKAILLNLLLFFCFVGKNKYIVRCEFLKEFRTLTLSMIHFTFALYERIMCNKRHR